MTERIRWREAEHGNLVGHVGTLDGRVFKIQRPVLAGERWVLTTTLPDWLDEVKGGSVSLLKSTAEAWLAEFVSSLGASFPPAPAADPDCEECGFGLPRHDRDCSRDPFGPEAYKSHRSGCVCWDCQAAREEAATAAGEKEQ